METPVTFGSPSRRRFREERHRVFTAHDGAEALGLLDAVQGGTEYPGVLGTLRKPFDLHSLMTWLERHC
jgi:hypothetical protein